MGQRLKLARSGIFSDARDPVFHDAASDGVAAKRDPSLGGVGGKQPGTGVQRVEVFANDPRVEQNFTVFKHQRRDLVQRVMRHHVGIQLRYGDLDPDGLNARGNPRLMRGDHRLAYEGRSRRPIETHGRQL